MIRIAIYDDNIEEAARFRSFLDTYFEGKGFPNAAISNRASLDSFLELVRRKEAGFFNMAFVHASMPNGDIFSQLNRLLGEIGELTPSTEITVVSEDSSHAFNAYQHGAQFLQLPFDENDFTRTIAKSLFHATAVNKRPFPVKCGKVITVLNLNDITYAEAGKPGPVIHLFRDKQVSVRGSLQSLHERLSERGQQFMRAGGSLIVNLDNIKSTEKDTVIFADDETVTIPVRSRKAVLAAFETWKAR